MAHLHYWIGLLSKPPGPQPTNGGLFYANRRRVRNILSFSKCIKKLNTEFKKGVQATPFFISRRALLCAV